MRAIILLSALLLATSATAQTHTITVEGEATIYVDPDHASIGLGVETSAPTVGEALSQNNVKMNAILQALGAQGVTRADVQTTVTVSDLTHLGAIVDAATGAGANSADRIVFETGKRDALLDKARAEAMRNAKHKAEVLAGAVGAHVGAVITIGNNLYSQEREMAPPPPPPPPPPPGTSILPGQLSVSANVTAVFQLN